MNNITPRTFSLRQAAQYMGMSIWFIRYLIEQGKIGAIKISGKLLVEKDDLDHLIEKSKLKVPEVTRNGHNQ